MKKLSGETLSVLYDYLDLLNEKKREMEKMVGDMEEVANLKVYESLLDERSRVYILIQELEKIANKEVYYGK